MKPHEPWPRPQRDWSLSFPLVKNTPHAPGRLFVGVVPRKHVGKGFDMRT